MIRWGLAILIVAAGLAHASDVPASSGSPVLVELFTSEGCSSCPPADALLAQLDRTQPVAGAQIIVLSEHVDYWNHDGWRDPFSSAYFTERQQTYARRFGLPSPYTPQMVVDGISQLTGSDGAAANAQIRKAESAAKVPLKISVSPAGDVLRIHVEADTNPSVQHKGDIYVALALNNAESQVAAGENQGRHLSHVAVVENIKKVGTLEKGKNFSRDVELRSSSKSNAGNLRVIAFVQEPGQGEMLGAAMQEVDAPK